jgi:hypothetical protein
MIYNTGSTSVSIDVQIVDDAGLAVTGLVAATFPTVKYSLAGANNDATISLSDLATLTTAWSSGGLKERGEGVYRLDLPNAALTTVGEVKVRGETSGKHLLAPWVDVGPVPANVTQFSGNAAQIDANGLPGVNLVDLTGSAASPVSSLPMSLGPGAISSASFTAGAIDANAFSQAAADEVWSSANAPVIAFGTVVSVVDGKNFVIDQAILGNGVSNTYPGWTVVIKGGTGRNQVRQVVLYNDSTKQVTVNPALSPNVVAGSTWKIIAQMSPLIDGSGQVPVSQVNGNVYGVLAYYSAIAGLAVSATSNTVKMPNNLSTTDGYYTGRRVWVGNGTGMSQKPQRITGYVGSTRTLTIAGTWAVTPDTTSLMVIDYDTATDPSQAAAANLVSVNGTTFAGGNVPAVLADAVTHGGANAALSLKSVTVTNPAGDAVTVTATGGLDFRSSTLIDIFAMVAGARSGIGGSTETYSDRNGNPAVQMVFADNLGNTSSVNYLE